MCIVDYYSLLPSVRPRMRQPPQRHTPTHLTILLVVFFALWLMQGAAMVSLLAPHEAQVVDGVVIVLAVIGATIMATRLV